MLDKSLIQRAAEAFLADTDMFLVEVVVAPSNEVEVIVDADSHVDIDACAALSRAIEAALDRDAEDFSLTVASAGIGTPLKLLRQYQNLLGHVVDVVFQDGKKRVGKLTAATETSIEVDGEACELAEVKSTSEHLDF